MREVRIKPASDKSPVRRTETNEIKRAYNTMYTVIREYIWEYDIVEQLVEVEMEAYKLFPDVPLLRGKLDVLRTMCWRAGCTEGGRILRAIDKFAEALDSVEEIYVKVKYPNEVAV